VSFKSGLTSETNAAPASEYMMRSPSFASNKACKMIAGFHILRKANKRKTNMPHSMTVEQSQWH
jgi:hypothetical protein